MKQMLKTTIFMLVLTLSAAAQAQFCKGQPSDQNTKAVKAISCKASGVVKTENGVGQLAQSLTLKCGEKAALTDSFNIGGGTGSYSVVANFNGQVQKEARSNIKVMLQETNRGLKGLEDGNFPFNTEELTKLAKEAKVNVKAIKTIAFYHTSESDYANIVVLSDAKGKVLLKGSLVIAEDTEQGARSKLAACK